MSRKPISTHEDLTRHVESRGSSNRSFGIVFAVFFLVVALIPTLHKRPARLWALAVALAFILAAFLWPFVLTPLNRIWTRIGIMMNFVMSPIVTAILFFGVFTPVAMLRRRFAGDSLGLHYEPNRGTYWINRQSASAASMDKQF